MQLIFISYSHANANDIHEIVEYLEGELVGSGCEVWIDEQRLKVTEMWHEEISKAIATSKLGVLLVTPQFIGSQYIQEHELPQLDERGVPITWVHLRQAPFKRQPFAKFQAAHDTGTPLHAEGRDQAARGSVIKEICENIREFVLKKQSGSAASPSSPRVKIQRARFPKTSGHLIGRDALLDQLNHAWDDPATHVVSLIAAGGIGKSALLAHWFDHMAAADFRGAERVFVWSFYGQGTEQQSNSDLFLEQALKWFDASANLPPTAAERGQLLAEKFSASRNLLILDGIEPLQATHGDGNQHRLRDAGLAALLTSLAAANPGLCVLSSRFSVLELAPFRTTAPEIEVKPLSPEAGAELLKVLQVDGDDAQRRLLAERWRGHALSLDLLGRFLWNAYGGDISAADQLHRGAGPFVGNLLTGPAKRLMQSYVEWFDCDEADGSVESRLLQMLGLFDRPARSDEIEALCRPPILGLSDGIQDLPEMKLRLAFARLAHAGLLHRQCVAVHGPNDRKSYTVDAHPLVRNYFGEQLHENKRAVWREAHQRLFEHLRETSPEEPQSELELAPLYAAVRHGCLAGLYEEAFDTVYWPRIHRRDKGLAHKWLGSNAREVEMIRDFFLDDGWSRLVEGLSNKTKARILGIASSRLRAHGDLATALRLTRESYEHAVKDWNETNSSSMSPDEQASRGQVHQQRLNVQARHRAELLTFVGRLDEAEVIAGCSVQYAANSENPHSQLIAHSVAGWVAHQRGKWSDALQSFGRAEEIYRRIGGERTLLHTLWGYRYAELLTESGRSQEVHERAAQAIVWARADLEPGARPDPMFSLGLLDLPLAHLMRVLADCADAEATQSPPPKSGAEDLDLALGKFKAASKREFEPLCELVSARWHRLSGEEAPARGELEDALMVVRQVGLRLLEADCHLEAARIDLRFRSPSEARPHVRQAAEIIERMRYGRRDAELQALRAAVK